MNTIISHFFNYKWLLIMVAMTMCGCSESGKKQDISGKNKQEATVPKPAPAIPVADTRKEPAEFVPKGFSVFEKAYGDLNKDGVEDCILIIKKIDKENIITDEYRGKLDRNRRGIIVLFKTKEGYELASKNNNCFSSENEEGGVYYAPELMVYAEKGNLNIHYAHGRYGYWKYIFRYQNSDFELIGYEDSSNTGPTVNSTTSINFSTKKKLTKINTNENAESGDEVFESTWTAVTMPKLLRLSEIKDFDELELSSAE